MMQIGDAGVVEPGAGARTSADAELTCDILVIGGGAGGVAAALAASGAGLSVCLVEQTDWLGGQLTAQGVCTPDEQQYVETFGTTARYSQFRTLVRDWYRKNYTLSDAAQASQYLNPGNCWVSRLSFEPVVGAQILRSMVSDAEARGGLRILFHAMAVDCEVHQSNDGLQVSSVKMRSEDGSETRIVARFVLDATDLGDLLPLCGAEDIDWTVGAESREETQEPDAPEMRRRDWVQPFTFPFALEWSPDTVTSNVISPPADYAKLKDEQRYHIRHGAITGLFTGRMPWWTYRRVLAAENFADSRVDRDLAMINTAGNDYYGGNVIGAWADGEQERIGPCGETREDCANATLQRARRASLGFVYWLQTECPREPADQPTDSSTEISDKGYPEFRLRTDIFDTPDGLSKMPYIRESRRIRSRRPILEQEIVVRDFSGNPCRGDAARAAYMADTVGVGHYALDIHPNGNGEPNAYVATRPFQIPLGALVPERLRNLLPACKNIGVTHLTNGAYRLHPIEWNIGESAALLAVFCIRKGVSPQDVSANKALTRELQESLLDDGVTLHWYVDVPREHPAYRAVQLLALSVPELGSETDLLFRPDEPIAGEDWTLWSDAVNRQGLPAGFEGTRSEAAILLLSS